jgi:hypothetical protein
MKPLSPVSSIFLHRPSLVSEVTPIYDQGQFAAYSTQRIGGVKRKKRVWDVPWFCGSCPGRVVRACRDRIDFDRAALPWYGRGNFPIDKNLGLI